MRLIVQLFSLLIRGTALMLGLVGAIMSLVCLGGAFSDRLDAFTHATPAWLALGVGAVVLGGLFARHLERKVMVSLGLTAIAACAVLMLPGLVGALRFKPEPTVPGDLKVIQFNVWHENPTPRESLDWVLAQKADIVVIEEAGGPALNIAKGLRAAYPYSSCTKNGAGCEPWIFSRRKILASGNMPIGISGVWAKMDDPAGPFAVVGVHLFWPVPAGRQQAQLRALADMLAKFDRHNLILTGDFNSTPWSFTLRRQDKALGLHRWTQALPSWPSGQFSRIAAAPAPVLPIDHVYSGDGWRAVRIERGPAVGSDHRPIVVTLRRTHK